MGRVMEAINRAPNREAIAALAIAPADVVVEIGYGPGCAIETLAASAPRGRVYGIDPSPACTPAPLAAIERRSPRDA